MKCQNCGTELEVQAKFCTKCGNKVEEQLIVQSTQNNEPSQGISAIWPEWQIEEKPIGRGSYGVVYKAIRRDNNVESHAAIKIISIPSDSSEVDSMRSEGLDMDGTRTYFKGIVDDFVSEIQLMESLKGVQNIVSVEDYKVVEKQDTIGWDIYIRMELLTPFNTYICDKTLTEEDIIKLGTDICTALEICGQRNIIHRDIKPENIFVNDFGYFKLGDFGIARKLENMTGGLSQKGTYNYMAPEVASSNEYDARVDTYSLGIVLYRLLNNNRLPFLDNDKQLLSPNERKKAVERRMRGETLPTPCNASPEMANLILRACAFDPDVRFTSATEMKQALLSIANGTYTMVDTGLDRTTSVRSASVNYDETTAVRKATGTMVQSELPVVDTFGDTPKKKTKRLPVIISLVLVVIILVGAGFFIFPKLIDGNNNENSNDNPNTNTSGVVDYSKLDREQIASIISEADTLATQNDYKGAITKIKNALVSYPNSESLKEKEYIYEQKYISDIITKTNEYMTERDYTSAKTTLKAAIQLVPNNDLLKSKLAEVEAKQPISLDTMMPVNVGNDWNSGLIPEWNKGLLMDPFGNSYDDAMNFIIFSGGSNDYVTEHYVEYRLYGKYSTITGTMVSHKDIPEQGSSRIKIYADDELVYTSQLIERKTDPQNFSVDVSGADYIKIVVISDKGPEVGAHNTPKNCLIMMDAQLWTE